MDCTNELINNFNKGFFKKAMTVKSLPDECPAWTVKWDSWVSVIIPINEYFDFSEKFSNLEIFTDKTQINDKNVNALMLKCNDITLREEFALIANQFIDPGINGFNRKTIVSDPKKWWKRWVLLFGNKAVIESSYPVLAEMMSFEAELKKGTNPQWNGQNHSTQDIETEQYNVEVKSTTRRYESEITISSIHQLRTVETKPLYLDFYRFEPSSDGRSINDLINSLVKLGCDEILLEKTLRKSGLEKGRTAREITFKVLEKKRYLIDENFPSITNHSFKNDKLPIGIKELTYTVDLLGIDPVEVFDCH